MAKKKKKTKKTSKSTKSVPKHDLPTGFWSQVGAVLLVVLSLLLVVSWFGAGGPVLEWLNTVALQIIGYAVYVLPILMIYVAVEVFRAEDNRLPLVMKFAVVLEIVWFAGIFGLLKSDTHPNSGGFIGDLVSRGTLAMVDTAVAALIFVLLIIITALFVARINPKQLIEMLKRDSTEDDKNLAVMRKAARADEPKEVSEIKLNAGVPTINENHRKSSPLSSLKNSVEQDKVAEEQSALVMMHDPNWQMPSLDLLNKKQSPVDAGDIQQNAQIIHDTLAEFNIDVEMEGANIGPRVTQYTLRPPSGVKLARITALETNIALNLAAQSLRIEAPIPGQKAVGIEVPNRKAADVRLYGVLDSKEWRSAREPLSFAIGQDISGKAMIGELNKMPHLLIAGQTGSGKSVMINALLTSLLYRNSPSDMKLILVDPKQVELAPYEDIPHLLTPVITEPEKTISALKWAVNEMERRYKLLKAESVRDIAGYNKKAKARMAKMAQTDDAESPVDEGAMPYIVIVIDELSDLMMVAARDVEALVVRLAQKARAVGIHLVLATQRPSVDVITGLIKANIPARVGFTVASQVDSRTILDQAGAEKLLGQGDMLLLAPSMSKPKRLQGAWVTDEEVHRVNDHLRAQSEPQYNDEVVAQPVQLNARGGVMTSLDGDSSDELFDDAVQVVTEARKASTSLLQLRLRVGYARAARIMAEMEERGIIGPARGSKPREVLISGLEDLSDDTEQQIQ